MLDDRLHLAVGAADDPAVTGGIVELDRQQRQRAPPRAIQDRRERLRARQRIGAEQHERHAVPREMRQRLCQRVAGALRRVLQRPREVGVGKALPHRVATVAVDHTNAVRRELPGRLQNVRQQRPAGKRVQDLRHAGAHPLAFAGSEDRDVEGRNVGGCHVSIGFYANLPARPSERAPVHDERVNARVLGDVAGGTKTRSLPAPPILKEES